MLLGVHHSTYGGKSGSAARVAAVADELLNALTSIDFRGVDVAFAVHAHLMQPMEFAGHAAASSEPAQLLQIAPVQDVDGHVGVVPNIETTLRLVAGETYRYRRSRYGGVGVFANESLRNEAAFARLATRIAACLPEYGIAVVKHLYAVIAPVADINLAVIGELYAMHWGAEECGLFAPSFIVPYPRPSGAGACVIDRIVSIRAEMTEGLACLGIDDQDAAVSVAVGDVQAVRLGIDHHVRRVIEQRRAIDAAIRVIAVWSLGSAADPQFEVGVHVELQYEAVAARLVGRPGRSAPSGRRRIPRNPDVVVLVDINAVLAVRPDAARFHLAFAADETGIGRTAPGAQQFAIGIKLQNGRSRFAAIRYGAMGAYLAQPVDRLAVRIFHAGQGPFQPGLLVGQGTRPAIDPDMVVPVDIEAADLAKNPVIGQRLGPRWIDDETRRLAGLGDIIDTRLLEQPFERAIVLEDVAVGIGAPAGPDQQYSRQRGHQFTADHHALSPLDIISETTQSRRDLSANSSPGGGGIYNGCSPGRRTCMHRHSFFAGAAALGAIPLFSREAQAQAKSANLKITAIELWQATGDSKRYDAYLDEEYPKGGMVRPIPPPGQRPAAPAPPSSIYMKILTDGGLEGFYGPHDQNVVEEVVKVRGVVGMDPFAIDSVWESLVTGNNRYTGTYMFGVSAITNTLWDMKGKLCNLPVYRLLGGSRKVVDCYATTIGMPVSTIDAIAEGAARVKKAGFKGQKWFPALGPRDGAEGFEFNVTMMKTLREVCG